MLICLIGSTCSGKTSILNGLNELGIPKVLNYTTRPKRPNEQTGADYFFVTDDEFSTLNKLGYFAETTEFYVNDSVWKYATSKIDIYENKMNRCIVINPQNLEFYKCLDDCLIVYVYSNKETILNRLKLRGSGADDAHRRMKADSTDFENIMDLVDIAVNNDGQKTPLEIAQLIKNILGKEEIWSEESIPPVACSDCLMMKCVDGEELLNK